VGLGCCYAELRRVGLWEEGLALNYPPSAKSCLLCTPQACASFLAPGFLPPRRSSDSSGAFVLKTPRRLPAIVQWRPKEGGVEEEAGRGSMPHVVLLGEQGRRKEKNQRKP